MKWINTHYENLQVCINFLLDLWVIHIQSIKIIGIYKDHFQWQQNIYILRDCICIWVYIPDIILHLSIVAKNILLQRSHNYGVWNYWQQKILYCICYTIWIDWHMVLDSNRRVGLIAPMALAHPLHPIHTRSRNRRRNLLVGWCVSSWRPLFPSRSSLLIYIYIYICRFHISIRT